MIESIKLISSFPKHSHKPTHSEWRQIKIYNEWMKEKNGKGRKTWGNKMANMGKEQRGRESKEILSLREPLWGSEEIWH